MCACRYFEKVKTTKVYVRDSSMVTPYPLLLFGGEIVVRHEDMVIQVDGWIEFSSMGKVAVLIKQLRQELDRLLVRDARWCVGGAYRLPTQHCGTACLSVAAVCRHVCGIVDSFRGGAVAGGEDRPAYDGLLGPDVRKDTANDCAADSQ
eukprot:COSAG01_NODE_191_length_22545_cov_259.478838_21_plen_149_part_00